MARDICGALPVLTFAGEIFSLASGKEGVFLSPNQQAMMLGAVQVVASILASSAVEKSGRKVIFKELQVYRDYHDVLRTNVFVIKVVVSLSKFVIKSGSKTKLRSK